MATDIVATWDVALSDGIHTVVFEHGTTTGKRVIILDGVEILRKNWMFRLVGKEEFAIGKKTKATIRIEAVSGFAYEYTLDVDGKPLKKFTENRKKTARVWRFVHCGQETRVVLGKLLLFAVLITTPPPIPCITCRNIRQKLGVISFDYSMLKAFAKNAEVVGLFLISKV